MQEAAVRLAGVLGIQRKLAPDFVSWCQGIIGTGFLGNEGMVVAQETFRRPNLRLHPNLMPPLSRQGAERNRRTKAAQEQVSKYFKT